MKNNVFRIVTLLIVSAIALIFSLTAFAEDKPAQAPTTVTAPAAPEVVAFFETGV